MKDGVLVLNKPQNWTSHDCVAVCRRILRLRGVKKIGHGGTLDPMAEGVLPIFIGQATRIMEYLELDYKTYSCTLQLGLATDTQDIWGQILSEADYSGIHEDDVLRAMDSFRGVIEQIPPMYSAVRIDGKRLYEYARKGRSCEVQAPPRKVHIRRLDVEEIDLSKGLVRFSADCSKGTYIRTICSDLGEILGCGAAMSRLRRTAVGCIGLDGAVSPEEIKQKGPAFAEEAEERLIPSDRPLEHFGVITMPPDRARYFQQGNSIRLRQVTKKALPRIPEDPLHEEMPLNARGRRYDRIYKVYREGDGLFLGTGYEDREHGVLKADKIFEAINIPKKREETDETV